MDRVIRPADRPVQRQREAPAADAHPRAELDALAPGHPDYPERHRRTLENEGGDADPLAALAALGLSRCDFSPWAV